MGNLDHADKKVRTVKDKTGGCSGIALCTHRPPSTDIFTCFDHYFAFEGRYRSLIVFRYFLCASSLVYYVVIFYTAYFYVDQKHVVIQVDQMRLQIVIFL